MSSPKRILVIDDDEDDMEIFLEVVSAIAPEVIPQTAVNGEDGYRKLVSLKSLPSMIFLDLNMPIMSGTEFLRKIKSVETLKHIPVVILTTSRDEWVMKEVRELGATDFVTKPDKVKNWHSVLMPFINQIQ